MRSEHALPHPDDLTPSSTDCIAPPTGSAMSRPDFLWGVATAAYQIEGAIHEDDRLPSIWDTFSATPGKTLGGDTGEHACEHHARWADDVDLIADLGVDAYRLSIAWPRVMHADGTPNQAGLGFYRRLLARLGAHGVQRYVTLYHWDLPQHLEDRGGWLNRDTAYRFAEYAALVARELSGLVEGWMTLNEPWCSAFLGHGIGVPCAGPGQDLRHATQAMHHLLLGHGLGFAGLAGQNDASAMTVGMVANVGRGTSRPPPSHAADVDAARIWATTFSTTSGCCSDPLFKGTVPERTCSDKLWPGTEPLVLRRRHEAVINAAERLSGHQLLLSLQPWCAATASPRLHRSCRPTASSALKWAGRFIRRACEDLLRRLQGSVYAKLPPIYITENGMASDDKPWWTAAVADPQRHSLPGAPPDGRDHPRRWPLASMCAATSSGH